MPNYFGTSSAPHGLGTKRDGVTKTAEFERKYGSVDRVLWMQGQPSVISGEVPCVNAHIGVDGMGRKADSTHVVPLTKAEHDEIEKPGGGIKSFCEKHSITVEWLLEQAAEVERRWQEYKALGHAF